MRRYGCGSLCRWRIPTVRAAAIILVVLVLGRSTPGAEEAGKSSHMVPMRDGVRLATDVYLPAGTAEPLPGSCSARPTARAAGKGLALAAGLKGYAVVAQDMRGRFDSEGTDAIIFGNDGWGEHQDGHDTTRVDRQAALVQRQDRHLGRLGPGHHAEHGCAPDAPARSRPSSSWWPSPTTTARPPTRAASRKELWRLAQERPD